MGAPKVGVCHICGTNGPLSFEHCLSKKAFNKDPIVLADIERLKTGCHPDTYDVDGRKQQRGAGAYTLCESCNNKTGHWYGGAYVEFAKQGMGYLQIARSIGSFYVSFRIKPLNVIKQVICVFMSANGPKFQSIQTELVRFVLNKEVKHLPSHTRLFAFYSIGDRSRKSGVSGLITGFGTSSSTGYVFSEITFPPFSFVLTFDCEAPDKRLTDITYFADDFTYNQERTIFLRLPVLPVYTFYPGDYRNREEVLKDGEQNLANMSR